jgi:CDP-glucose 4,6-dehydratase
MPSAVRPWQHVLQPLHGYLLYAEDLALHAHAPRALNFGPDADQRVDVASITARAAQLWRASGRALPDPVFVTVPREGMIETDVLQIDSALAATALGWRNVLTWDEALDWSMSWYLETADGTPARAIVDRQLADYQSLVCAR